MLADEMDYVLGVDTHRDEHLSVVITAPAGAVVAGTSAPADGRDYRELLRLAERYAPGRRAWAIEGTGSYGAGLARYLRARGESVLEVSRTPRAERRLRGKDDALDAVTTARAALASETLALPRTGGRREALRLLLVARRSAVDVRREALTQLRSVIVTTANRFARSCGCCQKASCSSAAAASAAPAQHPLTSSRPGSCCAASPIASAKRRPKLTSSSGTSSGTYARSPRRSSTSPASGRSSPPN